VLIGIIGSNGVRRGRSLSVGAAIGLSSDDAFAVMISLRKKSRTGAAGWLLSSAGDNGFYYSAQTYIQKVKKSF
jgi:hypothetical protein